MNLELNLRRSKFIPKFYPSLRDYTNRFEVYMGSAGSGKSHFIAQKLIIKALSSKRRVIVSRRYGSTLRNSVFALFKMVLLQFKILQYCKVRETDFHITLPNGSEFIFIGLDDEQKLLSLTDISDVFIEEASEINRDILEQLNLRMRGQGSNPQIFMAFNPIHVKNYLYEFITNPPSSYKYSHSTFKDNNFLTEDYRASLEELYKTNPAKARIYCDGLWGQDPEGLVYNNWVVEEFDPLLLAQRSLPVKAGMDMGYVDPSTIVVSMYDEPNKTIYVYDDYYKRGASLEDIVTGLEIKRLQKTLIYCDSADPRAIAFFRNT